MFTLNDDERVITETAAAFAAKRIAPHALEWDAAKHFPIDEGPCWLRSPKPERFQPPKVW